MLEKVEKYYDEKFLIFVSCILSDRKQKKKNFYSNFFSHEISVFLYLI